MSRSNQAYGRIADGTGRARVSLRCHRSSASATQRSVGDRPAACAPKPVDRYPDRTGPLMIVNVKIPLLEQHTGRPGNAVSGVTDGAGPCVLTH